MSMDQLKIRKMVILDVDWVIEMGKVTPEFNTGTEAAQFFSMETLKRWVNNPNGVTLIAEWEGKPAGFFLGSYMDTSNDGYLHCVVVEKNFRENGIGTALIEKAIEDFETKGPEGRKCDHLFGLTSENNETLARLAQILGFQVSEENHRFVEIMLPRTKR